jgi:hypothetical protein
MYARQGMPIERQTLGGWMGGWMGMAHEASGLIIEQIKRDVFTDDYVQCDETPVKYQDPASHGVCGTGYSPVTSAHGLRMPSQNSLPSSRLRSAAK